MFGVLWDALGTFLGGVWNAFEKILRRFGGHVWNMCLKCLGLCGDVLGDPQDMFFDKANL